MFTHNLYVSLACLSAGFFFAEMTIGPMWAIPMDIAPEYSGTASGMMNTGSALAAIISPVVGGLLIDQLRQLGAAVRRQHAADGRRRRARVPHAAGEQVRRGRGGRVRQGGAGDGGAVADHDRRPRGVFRGGPSTSVPLDGTA